MIIVLVLIDFAFLDTQCCIIYTVGQVRTEVGQLGKGEILAAYCHANNVAF